MPINAHMQLLNFHINQGALLRSFLMELFVRDIPMRYPRFFFALKLFLYK